MVITYHVCIDSVFDLFEMNCEDRPQDGLIAGEYEIEVQITCRNG